MTFGDGDIACQILICRIHKYEFASIPKLVTEISITINSTDVETYVAASSGQRTKRKAQCISAVGCDALRKSLRVAFRCAGHLWLGQISCALLHQ